MIKIRLNENQINRLFEHHSQQRLPFKDEYGKRDYEFADKNMAEEYLDWIEEFGKVGELDRSSFNFEAGFKSGLGTAFEWFKKNNYHIEDAQLKSTFTSNLKKHGFIVINKDKSIGTGCKFNDKGNMYVERIVTLDSELNVPSAGSFEKFVEKYNNNVGGCWCWEYGRAADYCSNNNGSKILLRGWIRLDDIDWVETVYINAYGMNAECEIRVKPNAKVELFEIYGSFFNSDPYYDDVNDRFSSYGNGDEDIPLYKFNLGGKHIIVTATYFGNNVNFDEDGFAEIYDSTSDEKKFMDRKGNILSKKDIVYMKLNSFKENINILQQKGINGANINDLFEFTEHVPRTPYLILSDYNIYCIFDTKTNKVIGDNYFDSCQYISNKNFQCFKVGTYDGVNLFSLDGKFLLDRCYTNVYIYNGVIIVYDGSVEKMGVYKGSSTNFIFDDINVIYNYDNCVKDIIKNYLEVENEENGYNIIDLNGNIISPVWFTQSYTISKYDGKNVIVCSDYDNNNKLILVDMITSKIIKKM